MCVFVGLHPCPLCCLVVALLVGVFVCLCSSDFDCGCAHLLVCVCVMALPLSSVRVFVGACIDLFVLFVCLFIHLIV